MTTAFVDYVSEQDAKNRIQLNIIKYCYMLCDALGHDAPENYHYELDSSGRKYHKIWMYIGDRRDSIHAFIDKKTGSVYKPASVKTPARGERYNVLIIESREKMFEKATWHGSYLYSR